MGKEAVLLSRRLINVAKRALRRLLRVFPFSLFYVLISATTHMIRLRRGHRLVCAGEVATAVKPLPRRVMIWLDRVATGRPEPRFDVCLRLPREAADVSLHDVFSVLLTSQRIQSIGLYWDSPSLADDLPLWQGKRDRREPMAWSMPCDDVGSLSFKQFHEYFQSTHEEVVLPVAATRDARTLLKRQAAGAYAVCLNVPLELQSLADAVTAAHPDVRFFDLATDALPPSDGTANSQSLHGYGLSLHERIALVQAADAYVGSFDELGCAALVSGRPAVLFGGGTGEHPDHISRDEISLWFPDPAPTPELTEAVLQFLPGRLGSAGN